MPSLVPGRMLMSCILRYFVYFRELVLYLDVYGDVLNEFVWMDTLRSGRVYYSL